MTIIIHLKKLTEIRSRDVRTVLFNKSVLRQIIPFYISRKSKAIMARKYVKNMLYLGL